MRTNQIYGMRWRCLGMMLILWVFLSINSALATTSTVCPSGCDYSTIQSAIDGSTSGDTIDVSAGTYTENLSITKDIIISGNTATTTIIDGNSSATIVTIAANAVVTLSDLKITNGYTDTNGAGISNEGNTTLQSVIVSGNTAKQGGGGIYNAGALTVADSTITDNVGMTLGTGFIGGAGIATAGSTAIVDISNSIISFNRLNRPGTDDRGGGGLSSKNSDVTITDSLIDSNSSGYSSGGIYFSGSGAQLTIRRTRITGNETGTYSSRNTGRGGGLSLRGGSTTLIDQSLIDGNISASSGGGVHADANVTITNSTISGNQAVSSAGGIRADTRLTVDSVTIVNNSAPLGGGFSGGSTDLLFARNTVIANNTATTGPDCYGSISIDPSEVVLVETLTVECTISGGGVPLTGTDPNLGLLTDNGGPTFTHLPNTGSILIDSGTTTLIVDQRGEARPSGSDDDIGAVEVQGITPPPTGVELSVATIPRSFNTDTGTFNNVEVTVFNQGPDTSNTTILTASYAGGMEAGPLPTNCSVVSDTQVVCDLSDITARSQSTVDLNLRFATASPQGLVLAVTSQETDNNPSNNTITLPIILRVASADIGAAIRAISGVNEEGSSLLGEPVTYELVAQNFGPDKATGVIVRARLPSSWEVVTLGAGCVNTVENTIKYVVCTLEDIEPPVLAAFPTEALVQFTVVPSRNSLFVNVTGTSQDHNTQNNEVTFGADTRRFTTDLSAEAIPLNNQPLGLEKITTEFEFRGYDVGTSIGSHSPKIEITIPKVEGIVGTPEVTMSYLGETDNCFTDDELDELFYYSCFMPLDRSSLARVYVDLKFNKVGSYEVKGNISSSSGFDPDLSDNTAISTIVVEPSSPIFVRGIEVTQVVQNWENGVDLYKGKKTVVRVSLQDLSNLGTIASGRLIGSIGGLPLVNGTLLPATGKEVFSKTSLLRLHSLDFLLPMSWTTLSSLRLDFEADVLGRQVVCQEPDVTPNCAVTVQFIDSVRPKINLYGIGYWEDELISILLDNVGEESPPSGTGTITLDLEGKQFIINANEDATSIRIMLKHALGLDWDQVKVITRKTGERGLADSQYGWWISLRDRKNYPPAQITSSDLIETNATATLRVVSDGGTYVFPPLVDIFEQRARLLTTMPTDKIVGSIGYLGSVFEHRPTTGDMNRRLKELKNIELVTNPQLVADIRYAGFVRGNPPQYSDALGTSSGSALSWFDGNKTGSKMGYARNVGPHEAYHSVGKGHAGVFDANEDPDDGKDPDVVRGICNSTARVGHTKHPYVEWIPDSYGDLIQRPTLGPLNIGVNREIWGFDTRFFSVETALRIVDPRKTWALMSYCAGRGQVKWPSSFGYLAAAIGIKRGFLGVPRVMDYTGAILLVSGGIGEVVNLSVTMITGSLPEPDNSGTINLALLDAAGNQVDIVTVPILPSFLPDIDPSINPMDLPPSDDQFQAALRNPGGVGSELVVSRDGNEIARMTASHSPPLVTLLTPVASSQVEQPGVNIAWEASDLDGDPLTSYVLYSRDDGTTWKVLANGLRGSQYFAPLSTLGQSETARFRVIVSDGFRSAEVISPRMVVSNSPPTVVITTVTSPVMDPAAPIMFEALAFDTEDELLNLDTLAWTSSIDDSLGQGESLYIEGDTLTIGCHIIQAEIADSAGEIGIGTLAIGIGTECQEEETQGEIWLLPYSNSGEPLTGEFSSTIPENSIINLTAGQDLKILAIPGQYQLRGQGDLSQSISGVTCDDPSGDTISNIQAGITMISLSANETIECRVNLSPGDDDNDGVGDDLDLCFDTLPNETVDAYGCSVPQILSEQCDDQKSINHGKFVSCVTHILKDLFEDGLITRKERKAYLSDAVHSK